MEPICALCCKTITAENDTAEHIIPNSIGGRRTVKQFICITCNSRTGETWDQELARQSHLLSVLLNIVRDRGRVPPLEISSVEGEKFKWHADGKIEFAQPKYKQVQQGDKVSISMSAPNIGYAKKMLKGITKKYPQVASEKFVENLKEVSIPAPLLQGSLQFGGENGGRSLVKTMLAYAFYNGINPMICNDFHGCLDYLRQVDGVNGCFGYYYEDDLIQYRDKYPLPLHCLAIKANPFSGLILGYLEYFGCVRVVMCLSKSYQGEFLEASYAIDPTTGDEFSGLNVSLNFNEADIEEIYNYQKMPQDKQEAAYSRVIEYASEKRSLEQIFDIAHKKALEECGISSFENMTEELYTRYSNILSAKFVDELLSKGMIKVPHRTTSS